MYLLHRIRYSSLMIHLLSTPVPSTRLSSTLLYRVMYLDCSQRVNPNVDSPEKDFQLLKARIWFFFAWFYTAQLVSPPPPLPPQCTQWPTGQYSSVYYLLLVQCSRPFFIVALFLIILYLKI